MNITMISPECDLVAKVGGLADVVYGLSKDLGTRGNTVDVILPKYDCLRYDQITGLTEINNDLWVPWNRGSVHCSVWSGQVHKCSCLFIEPHSQENFFNRRVIYGCNDDIMRFAFFCKASLEFLFKSGKWPDIIHCHDWATGLVPVLLYEIYNKQGMDATRVCYTIHNFRHQGIAGEPVLHATGLGRPEYFFRPEQMRDNANPKALNLMKSGIVYSNFVTTVSPHYSWEAKSTNQGYGLGSTLNQFQQKFEGVLNGVDYEIWNPETDGFIPARYSIDSIQEKYKNKEALRERLLMRKDFKPIVACIGRLDDQKGIPLIRHALSYSLSHAAQFILLGTSPDQGISRDFNQLKRQINDNPDCHLELSFNEELSHLIYAGADILVMPSLFEPCGLSQMIAFKYGTVPVVHAVGGLVNTVFDRDFSDEPVEKRNGFSFQDTDTKALESALSRALDLWYNFSGDFRALMQSGMRYDFSWDLPGKRYTEIYENIRCKPEPEHSSLSEAEGNIRV
jgi:glycogen/starch synthases, ADP-glucose type